MRRFPFHLQHDAMQCGVACLQMIFESYGVKYTSIELSSLCNVTTEGVSMLALSRTAERLGMHTTCGRMSLSGLTKIPLPCILHWNQNHFVVLCRVKQQRKSNVYYIADPSKGLLKLRTEDIAECWLSTRSFGEDKGTALLMVPTPKFGKPIDSKGETRSFRFLFGYIKKYSRYFGLICFSMAVGCLIQLIFPFLMQAIVDVGINGKDIGFVYLVLVGQLVLVLSSTVVDFVRRWILLHISTRINVSLVSDFFSKLFKLPMSYFDTKQTGDLLQRMGDHSRVQNFMTGKVLSIMFSLVTFVILGLVLLKYSVLLFSVFVLFSIVYGMWNSLFLRQRRVLDYDLFGKQAVAQDKTWQMITSMQEIKLQDCCQRHRWEWEDTQADLFGVQMKSLKLQQAEEVGGTLINSLKGVVVTILAAKAVIDGQMTLGMMLSVQYIIGQLASPVEQLMSFIYSLQDVQISLERINEVHQISDEDEDDGLLNYYTHLYLRGLRFDEVSFKYNLDSEDLTLDKVSITMERGTTTAIVGASGSGKTTLLKLLLGYYKPLEGLIEVAGWPNDFYNMQWWRSQCGVVMQDGIIFSESIARNIAVGDGEIDTERLAKAARMACIEDFIEGLPLKYNTKVGRNGMGLSAGQKQRMLIARAVYKDPQYLFLDEATNSLDANNERKIVANLERFFKGRTVMVIAHRLSTVRNADQIVVLEKGRVVECGTHAELSAKKGAYYELVKNQLEL